MSFLGTLGRGLLGIGVGIATGQPELGLAVAGVHLGGGGKVTPVTPPPATFGGGSAFAPGQNISSFPVGTGENGTGTSGVKGVTCPEGQRCIGASSGGVCLGTCEAIAGGGPSAMAAGIPAARGYHWNKHRYAVCGKGMSAPACVEKHTKLVRNRHMNPGNARAALHAARRLRATHHLMTRIEKAVSKAIRHRGGSRARTRHGRGCKCGSC